MKLKNYIFAISGLIGGFIISISIKELYNKMTNIELGNIIDYEDIHH